MAPLETAISELRQILAADRTAPEWRWNVRRRLSEVKEALAQPQGRPARGVAGRPRPALQPRPVPAAGRVTALAAGVLDKLDADTIVHEVSGCSATSSTTCSGCTTWSTTRSRSSSAARSSSPRDAR